MTSIVKHKSKDGKSAYRVFYVNHLNKRASKVVYGNKRRAVTFANRIEIEVQDIRSGIRLPPAMKMSIVDLKDKYLKYIRGAGRKESTIIRYTTSLVNVVEYFSEEKYVGEVSYADIEKYKAHRLETCTPSGVNIDLRHLRAFLNYCVRMEYIVKSPYSGVKQVKVNHKDVRSLSISELESLFKAVKSADDTDTMDLLLFYLNSGARANEILLPLFTWDSVKDEYIELAGKGDKTRQIGLNDTTREILKRRRVLSAPFPYNYEYVYSRIVRKYYKRVGIKDANLHSLRKTAGALLVQRGVTIYGVSRFLGHSSVTVTERHNVDLLQKNYTEMSATLDEAIPKISW
jgi:site-specific recombinase XerD